MLTAPMAASPAASDDAEVPDMHDAVIALLRASGATFSLLTHAPCKTSEESAAARGVPVACGAKAMLLRAGDGALVLAVLSAARRANLKALRTALGQKSVALASPADVFAVSRCRVGAVPPFGSLFRTDAGAAVRTLVDPSLLLQGPTICFNAGLRSVSVVGLGVEEWQRIEKPDVIAFSEEM